MQYLFVTVATLASISTSMAWKLSPNLGVPSCLYLNDYGEYDFTNIDCSTTAKLAACNSMCSLQDKGCDWADCFDNQDLYLNSCQNAQGADHNDPIADLKCASDTKYYTGQCYLCA